ncbi:MAG: serine/threonine-protein kinase, partial [Planctomycetaceae bacterium]
MSDSLRQFEQAWQRGERPRLDDYLAAWPVENRAQAFRDLLLVERRQRTAAGEACSRDAYLDRFPAFANEVVQVFLASLESPSVQTMIEIPPAGGLATPPGLPVSGGLGAPAAPVSPRAAPSGGEPARNEPVRPTSNRRDQQDLRPRTSFGRYWIEQELGRGGMGRVYLAHDQQLDRRVALKVPRFAGDEDAELVERFYREARAMATVHHPNLCPVFDVGQMEGRHFLTMAYIEGESLAQFLRRAGKIAPAQAAELLRKVAAALDKAHHAGIVHRDLKPANIMLTPEGEPIIMDFGLARRNVAGEAELTQSGIVVGSPSYMAPEQVEQRNPEIGPATDIWALGVVLYQLVTGRPPFTGSVASIMGQIVTQQPALPSTLDPSLPPGVDAVVTKALAKDPARRHASAREFATALGEILETGERSAAGAVTQSQPLPVRKMASAAPGGEPPQGSAQ